MPTLMQPRLIRTATVCQASLPDEYLLTALITNAALTVSM